MDTKALVFNLISAFIGSSVKYGFDINSILCIWIISKLTNKKDGPSIVQNIEYNYVD